MNRLGLTKVFLILPQHILFPTAPIIPALPFLWDPAFWDIREYLSEHSHASALQPELGELVFLYLGSITSRKLFHLYLEMAAAFKKDVASLQLPIRVKFVAAGLLVEPALLQHHHIGCLDTFIPRYLTEHEVISLQASSNVHWACYSKNFNQSSGIVGRAYQFGKTVLVRKGSLPSRVSKLIKLSHVDVHVDINERFSSLPSLYEITNSSFRTATDCS